jgi:predicted nucleic acid-binding Zn ribbon protein
LRPPGDRPWKRPRVAEPERGKAFGRGAQSIGDLLGAFLKTTATGRQVAREDLEESWRAAVGPEVAGGTRVRGFKDGVLTVDVSSSALLAELSTFYREEIIGALRAKAKPFREVKELTFKLGVFDKRDEREHERPRGR